MAFTYTFQKILNMKEKEKEQVQMDYSKSVQLLQKEQQRLVSLEKNKQEMERRIMQQGKNISLAELKINYEYIGHLQRLIIQANESKAQAEKEVEAKQFILSERAIEHKVWEKLKDHVFERYKAETRQAEQKELDEMAVARYYRQKVNPR